MDLKTFVREALVQVMDGVQEAQKEKGDSAWLINPKMKGGWKLRDLEFDIALTAATKTGGVEVVAANIGNKGERIAENASVSRIKFSIPIVFPMAKKLPSES